MTQTNVTQKCLNSPHSQGPVEYQPAPNFFSLANDFAKGKMFWSLPKKYRGNINFFVKNLRLQLNNTSPL